MPNCLNLHGISIRDGERVGCKQDNGTVRFGHYDVVLGAIIWEDDLTNTPTDFFIMFQIEDWLKSQ